MAAPPPPPPPPPRKGQANPSRRRPPGADQEAAMAPALNDDVYELILLRLPPDEPASLVRAALVCKPWRRLLSDPGFIGRFLRFHRTPPILGFLHYRSDKFMARFIPTSPCLPHADLRHCNALEARHGRVLIRLWRLFTHALYVWDPFTGVRRPLPEPPGDDCYLCNAAVLCASIGSCDHLDCHGGPFLVVLVCTTVGGMSVYVYSSEADTWRNTANVDCTREHEFEFDDLPGALAGNSLYFVFDKGEGILQYDLATAGTSVIQPPDLSVIQPPELPMVELPSSLGRPTVLMTMENGELGVARVEGHRLSLWSMEASPDKDVEWAHIRVFDLEKLLPVDPLSISNWQRFTHGFGVFFVMTDNGLFSIDIKSSQVRKVCEDNQAVPYMSFYTPDSVNGLYK
ncbi:hypothetical protein ACP70R_014602 [Stipagrostis hirtigluma subsp. patula]